MKRVVSVAALVAATAAFGADDRFVRKTPDSHLGFMPATDAVYQKECGTCHFAYLPGLMPARSWKRVMQRLENHFGENVKLDAATASKIEDFLARNAADVSSYEGSKLFMERIPASYTPGRLFQVPLMKEMHTVMREVINTKTKVKVRTLTNCNACHQRAAEGSFANDELYIPGLTGP